MDRERLVGYLAEGLSLIEIGALEDRDPSTVGYWVKKHGLVANGKDLHAARGAIDAEVLTALVAEGLPLREIAEAVDRSIHGVTTFVIENSGRVRCQKCRMDAVSRWRRRTKAKLVAEAGGCCVVCGYARHQGALHFHHLDPAKKEFHLADKGVTRSIDRLRAELSKCILLCANCHAEVEAGVIEVPCDAKLRD